MNGASDNTMHIDAATMLVFNAGIGILTFQCAIVLTLLFEMPYIKLLRIYTKSKKEAKLKQISKNQV